MEVEARVKGCHESERLALYVAIAGVLDYSLLPPLFRMIVTYVGPLQFWAPVTVTYLNDLNDGNPELVFSHDLALLTTQLPELETSKSASSCMVKTVGQPFEVGQSVAIWIKFPDRFDDTMGYGHIVLQLGVGQLQNMYFYYDDNHDTKVSYDGQVFRLNNRLSSMECIKITMNNNKSLHVCPLFRNREQINKIQNNNINTIFSFDVDPLNPPYRPTIEFYLANYTNIFTKHKHDESDWAFGITPHLTTTPITTTFSDEHIIYL